MTLSDIEPATFDVFVNWLYKGRLPEVENEWEELWAGVGEPEITLTTYT
jgi:hypothetical protein